MAVQDDFESGSTFDVEHVVTEESALLGRPTESATETSTPSSRSNASENQESDPDIAKTPVNVGRIISVLLIAVFIGNADGSIVIATYGTISSEFHQLEYGSWLTTSFVVAMCAAQPLVAKLSDIYGRKQILLSCYAVFTIGTTICGAGQTLWQVISGRVIAGLGGSGIVTLVSVLITDLVPIREVATWRSYVNLASTLGRSLGGPLGGWLADTVGWRWSFLGQVPFLITAFILVAVSFQVPGSKVETMEFSESGETPSRLGQIDFIGAVLLSSTIVSFLLGVDLPGQGLSWVSPTVIVLVSISLVTGIAFILYEAKHASYPIFPPHLLIERDVATSYLINGLQTAAQMAMMVSIPLYFQVTQAASNTQAGSHLVPAVVGNATGALLTGAFIKKTGRYKSITIFGSCCAMTSYTLLVMRWDGNVSLLDSLDIFPGGFATGIASSSTFVMLTSNMQHAYVAVATSGMYLASSIGMLMGVSISSTLQKGVLKLLLSERLQFPNGQEIIDHVLSDVLYVRQLKGSVRDMVISSYVESLRYSHVFSLICATLALIVSLAIKERHLA